MTEPDDGRFDLIERRSGYVSATLRLAATDAGGRKTPIRSGYRPQWDLGYRTGDGRIAYCDAQVRLIDVDVLEPGGEAEVRLHPFAPEYWKDVEIGAVLPLYEGNGELGEARVVAVVPPQPN